MQPYSWESALAYIPSATTILRVSLSLLAKIRVFSSAFKGRVRDVGDDGYAEVWNF